MRTAQIASLVLLVLVMAGWISLANLMRRRRELAARLSDVVPSLTFNDDALRALPSIRMRGREASNLKFVRRMLKMPEDLPLAHVMPPAWVFLIGLLVAVSAAWISHLLLSWTSSAVLGVAVWLLTVRGLFGWEVERYRNKLLRQLPDTVQLVVSATRAGLPVSEAFRAIAQEMASPTRDEFIRVDHEMALGTSPDEALLALHQRTGVTEYAIFAVTIGVQARSGGRLAETIQNLAETVRERLGIAGKARALAAEAKLSAIIMAILPVVGGAIQSVTQPKQFMLLFTDPRGIHMFGVGVVTLLLGAFTMQRLISGATRD